MRGRRSGVSLPRERRKGESGLLCSIMRLPNGGPSITIKKLIVEGTQQTDSPGGTACIASMSYSLEPSKTGILLLVFWCWISSVIWPQGANALGVSGGGFQTKRRHILDLAKMRK